MRRKTMLVLGVVCGVLCALCVALYMNSIRGQIDQARTEALERYGGDQLEVMVAKRDIAAGESIDASAIEARLWVADLLPSGAITSLEQVQGRIVTSPIIAGEVMSEKRFEGESKQLEIPEGFIAVSVPAKEVQAVGGAIRSGSKVDMYATGGTSTDVLAQDVLVLATSVDAAAESDEDSVAWITVAIKPDLAQGLVAAAQKMELYFTLPGEGVYDRDISVIDQEDANHQDDGAEVAEETQDTEANRAGNKQVDSHDGNNSDDQVQALAEQIEINTLLNQDKVKE